jgi:hypothetical protein
VGEDVDAGVLDVERGSGCEVVWLLQEVQSKTNTRKTPTAGDCWPGQAWLNRAKNDSGNLESIIDLMRISPCGWLQKLHCNMALDGIEEGTAIQKGDFRFDNYSECAFVLRRGLVSYCLSFFVSRLHNPMML